MNTEFFIARKIIKKDTSKNKVSKPIVKISLASIIIGIAVMLITVSVVTGFQEKIREKVIGFGSHIQISQLNDNSSMESLPILIDQPFVEDIKAEKEVKTVQPFAYKPAILQTDLDTSYFNINGKDTAIINRDIAGVLFKGIDENYDWSFFEDKLIKGELIKNNPKANEILISEHIANMLHFDVGDKINAYFIKNSNPKKRSFIVKGIYKTGLEDFDKKIIFCPLEMIQKINNWGVETTIRLKDTCINNKFVLEAMSYSYTNRFMYDWHDGNNSSKYKLFDPKTTKNVQLDVKMIDANFYGEDRLNDSLFSTAKAIINVDSPCDCELSLFQNQPIEYLSDTVTKTPFGTIEYVFDEGTSSLYTGGFEVIIHNWEDLDKIDNIIYDHTPFNLQTQKITDLNPEIFSWLDFLDMNIAIILTLMIIVSLINMTTSLLVLILEKTNMIGILKAIGSTNWSIRKIFLYNSFYLLSRGLIWGNIIGIGLLMIQKLTNLIPLDPQVYYLDTVPVSINLYHILLINILTIVVCMIVLILPSYLVTKINVVKAVKFD